MGKTVLSHNHMHEHTGSSYRFTRHIALRSVSRFLLFFACFLVIRASLFVLLIVFFACVGVLALGCYEFGRQYQHN